MKTKEQIFDEISTLIVNEDEAEYFIGSEIMTEISALDAMDEYAKQEAIAFAEFIQANSYKKSLDKKGWYKSYTQKTDYPSGFTMCTPVYEYLKIDELYSLYLQSKEK